MKPKTTIFKALLILSVLSLLIMHPYVSVAQEGEYLFGSENNSIDKQPDSETVLSDESGDPAIGKDVKSTVTKAPAKKKATPKKEPSKSAVSKPQPNQAQIPPSKETENSEESVLSFNFLHYIIQRFKFSDVIDE